MGQCERSSGVHREGDWLLSDKARDMPVAITRVTVVLNHGPDSECNPQIVEATEYRELPPSPELAEGTPDIEENTP